MNPRETPGQTCAPPPADRGAAARELYALATADELRRALVAVAAMLGGPHCAIAGRGAEEWVLLAAADLLFDGRPLVAGLPLWVALRDRAAEHIMALRPKPADSAMSDFRALESRVIARMVPQRLDGAADRVLRALCDGTTRTDEIAARCDLSVVEVLAARRAIAMTAEAVSADVKGGARRV